MYLEWKFITFIGKSFDGNPISTSYMKLEKKFSNVSYSPLKCINVDVTFGWICHDVFKLIYKNTRTIINNNQCKICINHSGMLIPH